jgi:hypothetical protein
MNMADTNTYTGNSIVSGLQIFHPKNTLQWNCKSQQSVPTTILTHSQVCGYNLHAAPISKTIKNYQSIP